MALKEETQKQQMPPSQSLLNLARLLCFRVLSQRGECSNGSRGRLEYWELSANFKKKSPRSPQFTGSNWKGLSQGREHSKCYFTFYLHSKQAWRGGESSLHVRSGEAPPSTEREKHRNPLPFGAAMRRPVISSYRAKARNC